MDKLDFPKIKLSPLKSVICNLGSTFESSGECQNKTPIPY